MQKDNRSIAARVRAGRQAAARNRKEVAKRNRLARIKQAMAAFKSRYDFSSSTSYVS